MRTSSIIPLKYSLMPIPSQRPNSSLLGSDEEGAAVDVAATAPST